MSSFELFWNNYIENFGVPILAVIGGLSFFSLNFYIRDIKNLRLMDEYIKKNKNLRGFKYRTFPIVGLKDFLYSFKNLKNFNEINFTIPKFSDQVQVVRDYRKYYSIVFPILVSIAIIGIAINELVIDK
ncbi:MAG: hypothetical protein CMC96_02370 [Flavobacteriales bacterium]|nr:hypothetical protein [Flavobacteriales bacterium]|tara:strand:+ start:77 stop:463 length:387 start_codon:yes stop_codon:yes gene_type:complete